MIRINQQTKRYFEKNRKPHFFILDTAWMAFMNLTFENFKLYVDHRKEQGFNGLLLQNFPAFQDMTEKTRYFPLDVSLNGEILWNSINKEFYDETKKKMQYLQDNDMTPFIVPMWVTAIPHSHMEKCYDCTGKQFLDFEAYKKFIDFSIDFYKDFNPVWMIGGDSVLEDEEETNWKYFSYMAEQIRQKDPQGIITAHVAGSTYIGERYVKAGYIDFYTYQSGHVYDNFESLMEPANMAKKYFDNKNIKPILNAEPMYEAHGFGNKNGRFTELYIRRAFWYSVLNGATSGFTYGAHGIWMFYEGDGFNNEAWSLIPMIWKNALYLPGSYDVVYSADIFKNNNLFSVVPAPEKNMTPYKEIAVAEDAEQGIVVAYTPYMSYIYLKGDYSNYNFKWHLLYKVETLNAEVSVKSGAELMKEYLTLTDKQKERVKFPDDFEQQEAITVIKMIQYNCDAVLIGKKN